MAKGVTIVVENVDPLLLRKQREWLLNLADSDPSQELKGLVELTDSMADYCADVLGDDSAIIQPEDA